jgi:hypothetical protein
MRKNNENKQGRTPWPEEDTFYTEALQSLTIGGLVEEAKKSHNWSHVCEWLYD